VSAVEHVELKLPRAVFGERVKKRLTLKTASLARPNKDAYAIGVHLRIRCFGGRGRLDDFRANGVINLILPQAFSLVDDRSSGSGPENEI
jgi:hypothetical protein